MANEPTDPTAAAHTSQTRSAQPPTRSKRVWSLRSTVSKPTVALVLGLLGLLAHGASAMEAASAEKIEASHLVRIAGHIEWPSGAFPRQGSPIVVGVVGSPGVYEALKGMAPGRPINGRSMEVRQLSRPKEITNVHMLYIGGAAWGEFSAWMSASRSRPVVVATNAPHAMDRGATIGFVPIGHRIALQASLPAADQAGIRLSSNVLKVAERVVSNKK